MGSYLHIGQYCSNSKAISSKQIDFIRYFVDKSSANESEFILNLKELAVVVYSAIELLDTNKCVKFNYETKEYEPEELDNDTDKQEYRESLDQLVKILCVLAIDSFDYEESRLICYWD